MDLDNHSVFCLKFLAVIVAEVNPCIINLPFINTEASSQFGSVGALFGPSAWVMVCRICSSWLETLSVEPPAFTVFSKASEVGV
jgi:hypothetical protein